MFKKVILASAIGIGALGITASQINTGSAQTQPSSISAITLSKHVLKISDAGFLEWGDTGQSFAIVESNSPENRLLWMDTTQLDSLNRAGVNTIYCSIYNEDGNPDLHPFDRYSNPTSVNWERVNTWKVYIDYWYSLNPDNIVHFILTEQENHWDINTDQFSMLVDVTAHLAQGRACITNFEEVENYTSELNTRLGLIRERIPQATTSLHNKPVQSSELPWHDYQYSNLVDLISIQAFQDNVDDIANEWGTKFRATDFPKAIYASEIMPYYDGFQENEGQEFITWQESSPYLSGGGAYHGNRDQSQIDQSKFFDFYRTTTYPTVDNAKALHFTFWTYSGKIGSFDQPYFDPATMSISQNGPNTLGWYESRYWIRPMPEGWHTIILVFSSDVNSSTELRLRAFNKNWNTTANISNSNGGPQSLVLKYYSDGTTDWKIAFDILGFGENITLKIDNLYVLND